MIEQRQKIRIPDDNYGRLYIALLQSDISSLARLCYGVMWSFGKDCWASVPSIARRMGTSENTVRKCQIELHEAFWIVLDESKDGIAKIWSMQTPEMRKTLISTPSGREGVPLQDVKDTPSGREGVPLQDVRYKKEGNQELKKERNTAANAAKDPARHPDQDACWLALKALWAERFNGAGLVWPATHFKGFQAVFTDLLISLGKDEILRRWKIHIYDQWITPSARVFFNDPDRWIEARRQHSGIIQEDFKERSPEEGFDPAREWRIQSRKGGLEAASSLDLMALRQRCKGRTTEIICDMIEEYFQVEFYGRNGRSLRAFMNQFERLYDKHREKF